MSLRVYLLSSTYYREVVFNAFSIQKIQRGRIFQRTDLSFKTAQKGKEKHQKLTDF